MLLNKVLQAVVYLHPRCKLGSCSVHVHIPLLLLVSLYAQPTIARNLYARVTTGCATALLQKYASCLLHKLQIMCRLSMDPGQAKLSAQLSSIVSRVIRQCLLALAEPASSSNSSRGQCQQVAGQGLGRKGSQSAGYLCREMQGDLKYILAFNSPRVSCACSFWGSLLN